MADAFTTRKSGVVMKKYILPVLISIISLETSVYAQVTDTDYDVAPPTHADRINFFRDPLVD